MFLIPMAKEMKDTVFGLLAVVVYKFIYYLIIIIKTILVHFYSDYGIRPRDERLLLLILSRFFILFYYSIVSIFTDEFSFLDFNIVFLSLSLSLCCCFLCFSFLQSYFKKMFILHFFHFGSRFLCVFCFHFVIHIKTKNCIFILHIYIDLYLHKTQ